MTTEITDTHPRISERRAEVEDQSLRSRNRKFLAVGVVVILALLAAASTQGPMFDVDEVRIVGAERKSPEFMRQAAAVELGTPLLGLDLDGIETRLEALPEVAGATATKNWRGVVTVEISERLPVARITGSEEASIVIGADGVVIEVVEEADPSLPLITGAMFTRTAGETVPRELADALTVASALPADIGQVTERIQITVDSLVLRLVGGGQVALGDARDLDTKFEAVRAFLAQVDLSCLESLNVRAPRVPVIVRSSSC